MVKQADIFHLYPPEQKKIDFDKVERIKNLLDYCQPIDLSLSKEKSSPLKKKRFRIGVFSFFFLSLIAFPLFFWSNNDAAPSTSISQCERISDLQADQIKFYVKQTALCEKRTTQSVHAELKRLFRYRRYREINCSTYQKIEAVLKKRQCSI